MTLYNKVLYFKSEGDTPKHANLAEFTF